LRGSATKKDCGLISEWCGAYEFRQRAAVPLALYIEEAAGSLRNLISACAAVAFPLFAPVAAENLGLALRDRPGSLPGPDKMRIRFQLVTDAEPRDHFIDRRTAGESSHGPAQRDSRDLPL